MALIIIIFCIIGFSSIALAALGFWRRGRRGQGGDSDEGGRGWGRGGGWRPRGPRPREPEPAWWPEFERDFRDYVRAQGQLTRAH
jgi:hypothetical protein